MDLRKDPIALQRLREAAEKAKIELSASSETEINLPYITATASGPKHLVKKLTRSQFEKMIDDLVKRTMDTGAEAMKKAGLKPSDIDDVILVGGSTRVPKVQEAVEKYFGKKASKNVNPDEVVAIGAAIQGAVLSGDVKDVLLLDVTPLSLGIETLGGVMTKLIEAGTTIPTKKSQIFTTATDNQESVEIHVLQGERPMAKDNKTIGRFHLDGIPPARRGEPQIEVTFDIDADGIIHVTAMDKKTGKKKDIRIEASSGLTPEEIERMKKEAEENAERDRIAKENAEKLNKADATAFQLEKLLDEHKDKLSDATKQSIEGVVKELKEAFDKRDAAAAEAAVKKAEDVLKQASADIQNAAQAQAGAGANQSGAGQSTQSGGSDDIEDVDYEEVK